ncbi:MAG: acetyl-CoA carboxylase biotin carboxyl carrier protein [Candidatus Omnitrophota bacterium]
MNTKKIKELIDLMNENGLTEIEVENEGLKIKLSKKGQITEQIASFVPSNAAGEPNAKTQDTAKNTGNSKEVKSPMVGTFYRSALPDSDPFVEIGDAVKKGDVLCIIEAMKLMNEIKSEFSGKIADILIENAEAVEFGQILFLVEPV